MGSDQVRPGGFEPPTCGLRVRSHPCQETTRSVCRYLTRAYREPSLRMRTRGRAQIWSGYGYAGLRIPGCLVGSPALPTEPEGPQEAR